jgi:hypothetical protein
MYTIPATGVRYKITRGHVQWLDSGCGNAGY